MDDKLLLDQQINKKQAEIQRLIEERDYLLSITPEEEAARLLAHFPRWNEGWGYELKNGFIDDWTKQYHAEALNKGRKIKGLGVRVHDLIKVLQVLIER